ncbi:MAG: hypothetical protein QGI13_00425 [Rhodospirillales bacterium]|jgi:hypothetical protein|nr:hypothetical protein [Rhodospirillales bacterium]
MIRSQSFLLGLIAVAVVLSGCQSDRQRYQIGDHENVQVPEGFFPEMAIERSWASGKVIYNFQANRKKMTEDTALTLEVMAYFEWLANDLRSGHEVSPYQVRKVLDARNELRRMVRIPPETSTTEAIAQLYSMSKFLKLASANKGEEAPEIAQRRQLLIRTKGQVDKLIRQTLAAKDGAQR